MMPLLNPKIWSAILSGGYSFSWHKFYCSLFIFPSFNVQRCQFWYFLIKLEALVVFYFHEKNLPSWTRAQGVWNVLHFDGFAYNHYPGFAQHIYGVYMNLAMGRSNRDL